MFKYNYFIYALVVIGFTIGFFALSNLYLNHGNEPVSSGPMLVWKGNGTGNYVSISATYYNASVLEYDVLRSALKDRFGDAFIEVGFSYEGWHDKHVWNEWILIFKEISLKVDDIEYIRSYFSPNICYRNLDGSKKCYNYGYEAANYREFYVSL
ncbi:MAG: hypothetical protein QW134_05045 [Nitrososphaeria archaeon]